MTSAGPAIARTLLGGGVLVVIAAAVIGHAVFGGSDASDAGAGDCDEPDRRLNAAHGDCFTGDFHPLPSSVQKVTCGT